MWQFDEGGEETICKQSAISHVPALPFPSIIRFFRRCFQLIRYSHYSLFIGNGFTEPMQRVWFTRFCFPCLCPHSHPWWAWGVVRLEVLMHFSRRAKHKFLMFSVGTPGTECLFGGICSGGSICIDVLCLCVDGEREFKGQCVEKSVYDRQIRKSESGIRLFISAFISVVNHALTESLQDDKPDRLPTIGLAGHPCGQGGVCRPSTKCIEGTCKCRQGYNPSFGECIRDLNGSCYLLIEPYTKDSRRGIE